MILMQIWMVLLKNSHLEIQDFLFYTQLLISNYHKISNIVHSIFFFFFLMKMEYFHLPHPTLN